MLDVIYGKKSDPVWLHPAPEGAIRDVLRHRRQFELVYDVCFRHCALGRRRVVIFVILFKCTCDLPCAKYETMSLLSVCLFVRRAWRVRGCVPFE